MRLQRRNTNQGISKGRWKVKVQFLDSGNRFSPPNGYGEDLTFKSLIS